MKRILGGCIVGAAAIGAGIFEYYHIPAVKYLMSAIVVGMILEIIFANIRAKRKNKVAPGSLFYILPIAWLLIMLCAAWFVGGNPWMILLLLIIIGGADIGAWLFGRMIGGDKMWEKLSPNKTWAGQIAGIICGTLAAVLFGVIGSAIDGGGFSSVEFVPYILWFGISVALLSQYGDLTASFVKRRMGIKDFSNLIPGHGGLLDRFDGWIYVLPIIWLARSF